MDDEAGWISGASPLPSSRLQPIGVEFQTAGREVPPSLPRTWCRSTALSIRATRNHCTPPSIVITFHHSRSTRRASARWSHTLTLLLPTPPIPADLDITTPWRSERRRWTYNPPMIVTAPHPDCLASNGHDAVPIPSAIVGSRSPAAVATSIHPPR